MNDADLDYLRAELAQAQQQGAKSLMVRTTELQGLLGRLRHLSNLPKQPVRVFGYARAGEVDQLAKGKVMTIRVRRKPSDWHTQPIYSDWGDPK